MAGKTIVISLQGVGNNLLALPLARALCRAEGAPVDMLVQSARVSELLRLRPEVGAVHVFTGGVSGALRLRKELLDGEYGRAVFSFPSGSKSVAICAAAGIRERIGVTHSGMGMGSRLFTKSRTYEHGLHDLEHNARIARLVGAELSFDEDWPPLSPKLGRVERARDFLAGRGFDPNARYVGLHTGCDSDYPEKRWPERHFAVLAESIYKERGRTAIVFDGPEEAGAGLRVARMCPTPVVAMNGWGDLRDALGMLGLCDLFVSNDSGIMNLSAAAGVPTLGIFGPSVSSRTRPFGKACRAVVATRGCVPCFDLGRFEGCLHPEYPCLEDLEAEAVAKVASEMLRE